MEKLDLEELQQAYQAGEISSASLVAAGESFELRMITKAGALLLVSVDGKAPRFSDATEAMMLLNSIGVYDVHINTLNWSLAGKSNYEHWLDKKVQASVTGLADGSNRTYSQEEWNAIKAARKLRGVG